MAALICGTCGNRFASYLGTCPACGQSASGARVADPPPAPPQNAPGQHAPDQPSATPPAAPPTQQTPHHPPPAGPPPTQTPHSGVPTGWGTPGSPQQPATEYAGWAAGHPGGQPAGPPPPAWGQSGASAPSSTPRKSRKGLWIALAGVGALFLVGGGVASYVAFSGDEGGGGDKGGGAGGGASTDVAEESISPVTSEPEPAWSWETDGSIEHAVSSPDMTVVSLADSGEAVALDNDGEELWSEDSHVYDYPSIYPDAELIELEYSDDDGGEYGSVVVDYDGEVVWESDDDSSVWTIEDDGTILVTEGDDLDKVDPDQEEPLWSIEAGEDQWLGDDEVLVVDGNDVVSYGREDGEEQWRTTLPAGHDADLDEDYHIEIAANDDFVLVSTGSLTALSRDGEDELWTESEGGSISETAEQRFLVTPYDGPGTGGEYPIYGSDGEVGTLDVNGIDGDYVSVTTVDVDGEEMNFLYNAGTLFSADGSEVEDDYDDAYWVVDGGYYIADGQTLGYREWRSDEPEWSLELGDVDPIEDEYDIYDADFGMYALDDAIIVNDRDTVWRYE